ncbi:MAG: hypothetical protein WAK17_16795 [Candidatus Nitrosopolaris sp.]|jgi:hypothetical protein
MAYVDKRLIALSQKEDGFIGTGDRFNIGAQARVMRTRRTISSTSFAV